ncbi:MAG TPA: hypothetical protein VGW31_00230 [Hanamia sp.]|jgi:hypothetical protein|nr:hypothetical protein [Hanamia sp.]
MEAIKIEILNPKALKLIKGMQELDLIRIREKLLPPPKKTREGWGNQIKLAIAAGDLPDTDPLENINNDWDNTDWTWPE